MEWFIENWEEIGMVVSGVLSVASLVTKLTPSPKDDEIVKQIIAWLSFLQPRGVSGMKMPMTPSMVPACADCEDCPGCEGCEDC